MRCHGVKIALRQSYDRRSRDPDHRRVPAIVASRVPWGALQGHRRDGVLGRGGKGPNTRRRSAVRLGTARHLRRAVVVSGLASGGSGGGDIQFLGPSRAEGARSVAGRSTAVGIAHARRPTPKTLKPQSDGWGVGCWALWGWGVEGCMHYRIGQIVPSSNTTMETEVPAMFRAREAVAPERFTFHSSRMRMKKVTAEALASMDAESDRCAAELTDARRGRHGVRVSRRHHVHGEGLSLPVRAAASRRHDPGRARPHLS